LKTFLLGFVGLLLAGCTFDQNDSRQADALARVGNDYLYASELSGLVAEGSSVDDSVALVQAYIDNWVRQHLILQEASAQLSESQKDFSDKIAEYQASLLRYKFENEVLAPQMDTSIDRDLIETYYNANKEQFELRRTIFQGRFVKVEKRAPKQSQLRQLLASNRKKDLEALEDYCFQYAFSFQLPDSIWVYADEVLRGMPSELMAQFNFGKYEQVQQLEDSLHHYYLLTKAHRAPGDVSPLSFEEYNIRSLILLQRRQEFIERYYQERYRAAQLEKKFEIYTPDR
jgi:hypothetical protein